MLVYSVNFYIILVMQHWNNIFLNFHCKILKIERVKKGCYAVYNVHHNSQQNHLKQQNKNAFVKGDVSRGNPGRIFFSIFQFFVALGSQKTDFRLKNQLICYCKINNY